MAIPTKDDVEAVFVSSGGAGFNTQTKNVLLRELLHKIIASLSTGGSGAETPQGGNPGDVAVFGDSNVLSGVAGFRFDKGLLYVPTGVVSYGVRYTPTPLATLGTPANAGAGARAFITDAVAPAYGVQATGGGNVPASVYSDGARWLVG